MTPGGFQRVAPKIFAGRLGTRSLGQFQFLSHHALSTTAVDIAKQEVRIRVAGSGTAGRGTGACAAMPTRTTRSR
jgi:hypothetical protein